MPIVCHDDDLALRKSAVEVWTIYFQGFSLYIEIHVAMREQKTTGYGEEGMRKGSL